MDWRFRHSVAIGNSSAQGRRTPARTGAKTIVFAYNIHMQDPDKFKDFYGMNKRECHIFLDLHAHIAFGKWRFLSLFMKFGAQAGSVKNSLKLLNSRLVG